ncbi:teichoic acids export ABC transporter ATP-binding subunit TagH [Camelliibacillus cellulosilyticus]|uniref:Teichoic acids export ABC transporter ATP-binding subunit TagH n=1 Tax=Camelliibacillus cellulosilyticus TaxID=2174486 RepID=A0ABV9GR05_9BACL
MGKSVVLRHVAKKYKMYKKTSEKVKDIVLPKDYGEDFYALQDISFEAEQGDVIGIIGVNGSGKSTLSNIIAGIIPPTSGTIEINGHVSLIAIAAGLNNELTGRENIELKCLMLGFSKKEIKKLEPEIIEFAEIGKFIDQPVKSYSSGMKSRLGFAISVTVNPDILVIDEALSVGDQAFAEKCLDKMNSFKEQGKTIFFISHSIGQMKKFCEKALWIQYGKVEAYGPMSEVMPKYEKFLKEYKKMSKKERDELQWKAREKKKVIQDLEHEPDSQEKKTSKKAGDSLKAIEAQEEKKENNSVSAKSNPELSRTRRKKKKKTRKFFKTLVAIVLCLLIAVAALFLTKGPKQVIAEAKSLFKHIPYLSSTKKESPKKKSVPVPKKQKPKQPTNNNQQETFNLALVNVPQANVRDEASTSGHIMITAEMGDTFKILNQKTDPDAPDSRWVQVEIDSGERGWISQSIVETINSDKIKKKKDLPILNSILAERQLPATSKGLDDLFQKSYSDVRQTYLNQIINSGPTTFTIKNAEFHGQDDLLKTIKLQNIYQSLGKLKSEFGKEVFYDNKQAIYIYFINGFNIEMAFDGVNDKVKNLEISVLPRK